MALETALSIATLGVFIWVVRFLLPKALKDHDSMAITCTVLMAILTLLMWLLIGVGTRSAGGSPGLESLDELRQRR